MIRLHVLGAGGAVFTPTRGPAAYWLEIDGQGLLLDPGPGALVRLVRQPGAPDAVDELETVLISHLHLDHTADLAPLLFALHSILARETAPLRLVGPVGLASFLERLRGVYGSWLEPRRRPLELREIEAGGALALAGGGRAEAFATTHEDTHFGAACLGWCFEDREGRRLVYSGDTGPSAELEARAAGCDLLLVECSTPDELAVDGHLSPARVAEIVRNARPARVVLTHLYPPVAATGPDRAVHQSTGVPCTAARDGEIFEVSRPTESRS
jgi:ribonuclease BN (tRNA processing enzyme)